MNFICVLWHYAFIETDNSESRKHGNDIGATRVKMLGGL